MTVGTSIAPADEVLSLDVPLRVAPETIHVWAFSLQGSAQSLVRARAVLSDDERARADRFVFARHRDEYIVAHGVLRSLLGAYSGVAPSDLLFRTGPAGKPALEPRTAGHTLSFNLTHSNGRALLAVSDGRDIGVDLECVREDLDALSISGNYFFGTEHEAIAGAAPDARRNVFFRYWVAKEAVLKACGLGLGFPLDRFRIEFARDGREARVDTLDPSRLSREWIVKMLPCEAGWLGAVAALGGGWSARLERPPPNAG